MADNDKSEPTAPPKVPTSAPDRYVSNIVTKSDPKSGEHRGK